MKLTKDEFAVLWNIEEGNSDKDSLSAFTGFDIKTISKIADKLEKLKLIKITKKFDRYYKKEFWQAETTEKAKESFHEYDKWITKLIRH